MDMANVEILQRARSLIADGWSQRRAARKRNGDAVPYWDDRATCFCIEGALFRAFLDTYGHPVHVYQTSEMALLQRVVEKRSAFTATVAAMHEFNDAPDTTKEDVLAVYAEAIAILERRAAV